MMESRGSAAMRKWFRNDTPNIIYSGGGVVMPATEGNIYYVGSTVTGASDSGRCTSPGKPAATLDYAIEKCTANQGDIIIVLPGHAESISSAGALSLDVAGISIIGRGRGASRPTFTFDTAITADMNVDAANITLANLIFVNGIDNLTAPIDVNAADFSMIDCETRDNNASYHCDDFIQTVAAATRLYISGWVHRANGGKTGAQTAISIIGGNDHVIIPKSIDGDFATACIENVTTACDTLKIFGTLDHPCYLRTRNSADVVIACVATTKGHIGPNIFCRLQDNAANITTATVGAAMEFFQPIELVNADGESSMQTDITATTNA